MTDISAFREPVRALLGDLSDVAGEQNYTDNAIDKGVRSVVVFGGLSVVGTFAMADATHINPDLTTPPGVLLLCAKVAKMFTQAEPSRQALRLRPFSQSVGDYRELVTQLDRLIEGVEGAGGIEAFRSFSLWLSNVKPGFAEWYARWQAGESLNGLLVA